MRPPSVGAFNVGALVLILLLHVQRNEGGGVVFGFDDTGEVGVLRNEEAIRKKWRGERDPCGPLLAGTVWVVSNHVE